jgi:hypothetical protein
MDVRAAEVEGPVSVMTIGAFEVRVGRRMRLRITLSLNAQKKGHMQKRVYNGWVGVPGPAAEVCCP